MTEGRPLSDIELRRMIGEEPLPDVPKRGHTLTVHVAAPSRWPPWDRIVAFDGVSSVRYVPERPRLRERLVAWILHRFV